MLNVYFCDCCCLLFNSSHTRSPPPARGSSNLPLPAHPRHFHPSFYLTQAFSFFINPVHEFARTLSPQSLHFLPHLLLDRLRFLRSFGSPSVHFFSFRFTPSIFHMATTVRQPKPTKKGFPGDNPQAANRSVSPPPSHSPLPSSLISLLSHIAAVLRLPGVERVPLRPSLPVPIMLVSQTGLPPPLPRKQHLSLLSPLPRLPLARITKPFFRISRVSLYVSPITCLSLPVRCLFHLL